MAQVTGLSLPNLYSELNRFGQNQEYERALKVANKILQESPSEGTAFHCKIVCLINLEKFGDALNAINKDKTVHSALRFEKAYCEYRLNRTQEAVCTLRAGGTSLDNRCKELLAQVLYRLEEYKECYEIYKDLIKNSQDEYDEERETNLTAVLASLRLWDGKEVDSPPSQDNTYERCYNRACYLVGKGDLSGAEEKLKQAESMCKENLSEDPDITDEEIDEELAIIRVQMAYILQIQGREKEALAIYNQVQKSKPEDVGLMAVLSNNLVAVNKDQNVFDSKKKMKVATGVNLKHKLTSNQRRDIDINQCLLMLLANQGDQCHQLARRLREQHPNIDTIVLIEAAQYMKDKQTNKTLEILEDYAKSQPGPNLGIWLAITQLHLHSGSIYKACDALKQLGDLRYKPGVVSAMVTLYMNQEDLESAMNVLAEAVDWTRKHQPNSESLQTLLRVNTNFLLKHGGPVKAVSLLEELRKKNPKDTRVLAQLISAYSKIDPAKAQKISRELPLQIMFSQSVDVEGLEMAFSSLGPKYMKKMPKAEPSPGPSVALIQKKNKKKKKTKLPKNYNPDVSPDPERWLPKRERSYYRGKRKDKKKDIGKGSQGTTSGNVDYLDASKSPSASGGVTSETNSPRAGSASTTTAPVAAPQGPRQQKPAHAQKKKKKKGGGKGW